MPDDLVDIELRLGESTGAVADWVVILDADLVVQYANRAATDALSLPDELGSVRLAHLTPSETALAKSDRWSGPLQLHSLDGRSVDVEASIVVHRNPGGEVSDYSIVARDVGEQQRVAAAEARLRESEARYRAIVDDQIELVCRYLPDTTLTFVNRAFAEFHGGAPSDFIGTKFLDLYPLTAREGELARLRSFGPGAEVQVYEDWELAADGSRHWYRWFDRAFLDDRDAVVEFQSVGRDMSRERRTAVLTANEAEILRQVARGVPLADTLAAIARAVEEHFPRLWCGVLVVDHEHENLSVGAAPTMPRRVVNALEDSAVASAEPMFIADVSRDPAWNADRSVIAEHRIASTWSIPIRSTGAREVLGTVIVLSQVALEPDEETRDILSLVAHLAAIAIEHKKFEEQLAHQAMHDPLTVLPNRLLFLDRLGLALARARRTRTRVAVLFLDLDRFKNVNDSLGHETGDELLAAVARRLESVLRPGDTVARFGGDEFTILCEDLPGDLARDRALEIVERLRGEIRQPFIVRDHETFIAVSVGIAFSTNGDERPEELLRDADAAMYYAKEIGPGRVEVFDDAMRERALARHETENALHRAIDRGELRLFFQPIIRLDDAACIGVEALVRWQHPDRGLMLPSSFVPLAEQTGLIVPLGAWVLEQAAAQAARWHAADDREFTVSVNLSARQLAEPDLSVRVADIIERSGVQPSRLCFEITETVFMEDADAVTRVMERVRAMGVRFAIDDFGTGYSSLGYLKQFAVDSVKVDRAFVAGLADDPGDVAIVSAVVGLAHALGLRVVAEGVETEAQLGELLDLGCDAAQGYFFAPPQPAADLSELLSPTRRWRPPGATTMQRHPG